MRKQYLIPTVLGAVLITGSPVVATQAWADDTAQLKEQVQALQNRVDQLQAELANNPQSAMPAVPVYGQWEDPFAQMMQMQQQMQRSMRQAFAGEVFNPKTDIKQTDKQYVITMDIPGMDKDKINVETKEDMLIISGERRSETRDNKNNQYYRQERSFGTFMQAIPLPEDAQKDRIEANYKNGVLTVTVGREKKEAEQSQNEKIPVK